MDNHQDKNLAVSQIVFVLDKGDNKTRIQQLPETSDDLQTTFKRICLALFQDKVKVTVEATTNIGVVEWCLYWQWDCDDYQNILLDIMLLWYTHPRNMFLTNPSDRHHYNITVRKDDGVRTVFMQMMNPQPQ